MHFDMPDSTATDVRGVITAIMQAVLSPAHLIEREDDYFSELNDYDYYGDNIETTLVIGHYEIDEETNVPLDPALLRPLEEGELDFMTDQELDELEGEDATVPGKNMEVDFETRSN